MLTSASSESAPTGDLGTRISFGPAEGKHSSGGVEGVGSSLSVGKLSCSVTESSSVLTVDGGDAVKSINQMPNTTTLQHVSFIYLAVAASNLAS